jgi:hypothetical protein
MPTILEKRQVFKIGKRFPGFDTSITFSGANFKVIRFPHDNALILALKMKPATEGVSQ